MHPDSDVFYFCDLVGLSCDSTELWRVSVVLCFQDPVCPHSLEVRRRGGL